MYHGMKNFNMMKEIEKEGQATHQLIKEYGYISGVQRRHNIIDKYII